MPPFDAVRLAFVPPYCSATGVPCHVPVPMVPTEVSEDDTTFEASVVPVSVPAGATTAAVPAAVMRPLPLTVKVGIAVEDPKLPVLVLTVFKVKALYVPVKSPLNAVPVVKMFAVVTPLTVVAVNEPPLNVPPEIVAVLYVPPVTLLVTASEPSTLVATPSWAMFTADAFAGPMSSGLPEPESTVNVAVLVSSGVVTDVENTGLFTVATVIEPAPSVIKILLPVFNAAATGAVPVEPMSTWPFVGADVAVIAPPAPEYTNVFAVRPDSVMFAALMLPEPALIELPFVTMPFVHVPAMSSAVVPVPVLFR